MTEKTCHVRNYGKGIFVSSDGKDTGISVENDGKRSLMGGEN
jgi:hypothetical protein